MFPEAVKFAKEIAGYVKDKFQIEVHIYADSLGTIYWISDYADYAAYGKARAQAASDEKYWALIKKAAGLFIEGTVQDRVISSL